MSSKKQQSRSGRFLDLSPEKLRGGYYTSSQVADWLCSWAIRLSTDSVLEPSCGDGVFLKAAAQRFAELGVRGATIASRLTGIEVVSEEAARARAQLHKLLGPHSHGVVRAVDFFSWWKESKKPVFDAVVGNPPFIRYQAFPEPHRSRAMAIMVELGLSPNRLTNIWVPFVATAVASLKPGGRLALVLPAELLQVSYAAQLRAFLADRFSRINIIACNELFFEKAEQEVVLLLAEGLRDVMSGTRTCRVALTESKKIADITGRSPAAVLASAKPKTLRHDNEKWLKYFLDEREITLMRELRESNIATTLSNHACVDVGVVTGKNEFFVLTADQVARFGLKGHTKPLVSRSLQLKGARLDKKEWNQLSRSGYPVYLLDLSNDPKLSTALTRYIHFGEANAIQKGYKCSIRTPWYAVPSIWKPDGFLFRQIYDFPRMVLNQAGATSTDTIHRLTCKASKPELIITNIYTWLTAASAEIEGRSYGGGVLELEPTEAERLLVPAALNGAMPLEECDRLTRAGQLDKVLEENARIILMGRMGLSRNDCALLRGIWIKMRNRRLARRRHPSGVKKIKSPK